MKICPQCQTTYTDDSLQFCLQDGNPLNFVSSTTQNPTETWNEPETVIKGERNQMRFNLQEPQTQQQQSYPTNPTTNVQPPPPKKSKAGIFIFLALFGLVALVVVGAVGAFIFFKPTTPVVQNTTPNSNTTPNVANANTTDNANANSNWNTATPTPKPTLKPAEIETAKKEAESAIYGWKAAAENHNLDTNLSNYADTVDYYKGGKISKAKVRASKEPAYKKYDQIDIEISNMKVSVDPTGEKATVTFDKTWDFAGVDKDGNDVINRGSVQQQLILIKIGGKWKISSEKDMKLYYQDKGEELDN